jgi:hypothetical protein
MPGYKVGPAFQTAWPASLWAGPAHSGPSDRHCMTSCWAGRIAPASVRLFGSHVARSISGDHVAPSASSPRRPRVGLLDRSTEGSIQPPAQFPSRSLPWILYREDMHHTRYRQDHMATVSLYQRQDKMTRQEETTIGKYYCTLCTVDDTWGMCHVSPTLSLSHLYKRRRHSYVREGG